MTFSFSLVKTLRAAHPSIHSWVAFSAASFLDSILKERVPFPETELNDRNGILLRWQDNSVVYEYEINGDKHWPQMEQVANSLIISLTK